jgi:hypothetical protein
MGESRKKWIDSWAGGMEHRGIEREYRSFDDFVTYINNWNTQTLPHHLVPPDILVQASHNVTRAVYRSISDRVDVRLDYENPLPVDTYNAVDYLWQNPYPKPERYQINKILDFGAGFGRQAKVWSQTSSNLIYCAVDAIESSYCVQH